jgi:hypothetical protein
MGSLKTKLGACLLACAAVLAAVAVVPVQEAAAATSGHFTGTLSDGTIWVADVPANWNGMLVLYSHAFGTLVAKDAPTPSTQAALLTRGYALAGSSYDPTGSEWALDTAVSDQFETLQAMESTVLPTRPHEVLAFGTSMGGLISALEAQDGAGRINGALTTCGIVGGGVNLNEYQLDGEYALAQLLLPGKQVQLVGFTNYTQAFGTAATLQTAAAQAQQTAAGRARLALVLAFLNVPTWTPSKATPAPANSPATDESAQYNVEFTGTFTTLDFIEAARLSITEADGGSANWTVGTNFASVLDNSPYRSDVAAMYRAAGLNLRSDLNELTDDANITANPAALRSLEKTSVPDGHLAVPELDLHTIGDQLVAVQQEDFYANEVESAGDGDLLRQAFVSSYGHCNFSPGELVAGILAIGRRVATGQWGQVADPSNLNQVASSLDLGPAQFDTNYYPGPLTGAVNVPGPPGPGFFTPPPPTHQLR